MAWLVLAVFGILFVVGAWYWGKVSDPRNGGTVGCCHCGQCIATGECVMRRNLQKKAAKKESAS